MKKLVKFSAFMLAAMFAATSFTSCGEDDETTPDDVAEQFKFNGLTAIANNDGTITIGGHIETNTKLKEFCLYKADGTTKAYDFLEENEQVKNKNKELDENGKTVKDKFFALDIASKTLPVEKYVLAIKTKKNGKADAKIGEDYSFKLGYGSKSKLGSYVSFKNLASYTMDQAEANAKDIEFVLSNDKLKVASQSNMGQKGTAFAKSAIFSNTIITSTGCIAVYTLTPDANGEDATISGVVLQSKEGILDIKPADNVTLSK